jgi:hypothetical protein
MPLITSLVSFGHCIVCPSIYASDYLFGIFWSLYCLSLYLLPLITSLVSFGHCIVCPSIYASDYLFGIFWPLYCLSFYLCLWLPLWYLLVIVLSVLLFTASDYLFGIFWPLYCLSFYLVLLITSLVSFGHCIVCPSIYCLWLPLWYLLAIVLSVLLFSASDYLFGIFWSLYCLSFYLLPLITFLVSFGHCIVCPSLLYDIWLPLWYLQTFLRQMLHCFLLLEKWYILLWFTLIIFRCWIVWRMVDIFKSTFHH